MSLQPVLDLLNPTIGDTHSERWGPLLVVITWIIMGFSLWFLGIPPITAHEIREGALAFWGLIGGLAYPWLKKQMTL